MLREMPYFMENEDWYETPSESSSSPWFSDGRGYHIKDSAPEKQRKVMRSFILVKKMEC